MNKGLSLAFTTAVLWAIYNVFARYSVGYDINPAIFVCIGFMSASFILLLIAGQGKLGVETLRSPATWWYSIFGLLEHIITLYLFIYVTSTEGSLMQRINVLMAMFIAYMFFSRKPTGNDIIGGVIVSAGALSIISNLDPSIKGIALLYLLGAVITQTIKTFLAETHPISNQAITIKDRCRVTAIVSFTTSIAFISVILLIAYFKHNMFSEGNIPLLITSMPSLSDFLNAKTFLLALVFGIIIEAPSIYAYFYSVMLIKTEKFLAITALVPIFTLAFEYTLASFGILDVSSISNSDLMAGGVITFGAIYMVFMRHRRDAKLSKDLAGQSGSLHLLNDDYNMVCTTLERCNGSMAKVAKMLEVNIADVISIHTSNGEKSFKKKDFEKVARNFQRKVAMADTLTGLANRDSLMQAMKGAIKDKQIFSLLFIDLNKFKPINDTYGHDVGDKVLRKTAKRLTKYSVKKLLSSTPWW